MVTLAKPRVAIGGRGLHRRTTIAASLIVAAARRARPVRAALFFVIGFAAYSPALAVLVDGKHWLAVLVLFGAVVAVTLIGTPTLRPIEWQMLCMVLATALVADVLVVVLGVVTFVERFDPSASDRPPDVLGLLVAVVTTLGTHQALAQVVAQLLRAPYRTIGNLVAAVPVMSLALLAAILMLAGAL